MMEAAVNTAVADYALLLQAYHLPYHVKGPYLQVGVIPAVSGWVLELGIIKHQLETFIPEMIRLLAEEHVAFVIPVDSAAAEKMIGARLGPTSAIRVVVIYPENTDVALRLANMLVKITAGFRSPDIPGSFWLGGTVYTRFIAFSDNPAPVAPFRLPADVIWPFSDIKSVEPVESKTTLKNTYTIKRVITLNPKGDTFECTYRKNLFQTASCFIKQGRRNTFVDEHGRDIQDRLSWQYALHNELKGMKGLPKVIELFSETHDSYLVMELVQGASLTRQLDSLAAGMLDTKSPVDFKVSRLDWLMQIINLVNNLHERGYVHRDITPENFLITDKGIYMIDLELAWKIGSEHSGPPFYGGTSGFMSPAQAEKKTPELADDVYSLGALIFNFFTSISPVNLLRLDAGIKKHALRCFLLDNELALLVDACLNENASARPSVQQIIFALKEYQRRLIAGVIETEAPEIDGNFLEKVLEKSLAAFHGKELCSPDGIWGSQPLQGTGDMRVILPGFRVGISGILYMLSHAAQSGLLSTELANSYKVNYGYLEQKWLSKRGSVAAGLYDGKAGIALALSAGIKTGLLPDNVVETIVYLLEEVPGGVSISSGAAGHGLAVLACFDYLPHDYRKEILYTCVEQILNSDFFSKRTLVETGFDNGIAGVVYFLWCYFDHYYNEGLKTEILAAMAWLDSRICMLDGQLGWYTDDKKNALSLWHSNGVAGILRCYLKAWQVTGDVIYEQTVTKAVESMPSVIRSSWFTYDSGCSGLGDVLLEISECIREGKIKNMASDIANILLFSAGEVGENKLGWYWFNNAAFTADLFKGNAGCIYFLMRIRCKALPSRWEGLFR